MAASRPPPPTTMDSLARVDLTALRTDAVLMYVERVMELSVARTASPEKLQMLLMLSQKLLQWFLDDRRELERLRQTLQEELLRAWDSRSPKPSGSASTARLPVAPCYPDVAFDTHAVAAVERMECGVQVQPEILQESAQTEAQAGTETLERSVQTEADAAEALNASAQTETAESQDGSVQTEVASTELFDATAQTEMSGEHSRSSTVETQTEVPPVTAYVECSVQADTVSTMGTASTQTDTVEHCVCSLETQIETAVASVDSSSQVDAAPIVERLDCGVQVAVDVVNGSTITETAVADSFDAAVQAKVEVAEVFDACEQTDTYEYLPSCSTVDTQTETSVTVSCGVDCSVQVEAAHSVGTSQTDAVQQCSCSSETQTENATETVEGSSQAHAARTQEGSVQTMETTPHCTAETQTTATECQDRSAQVAPSSADWGMQVEVFAVDHGVQTIVGAGWVDDSTQDDRTATTEVATQSESFATVTDCSMQVEVSAVDHGVQTTADAGRVDGSTQDRTATTEVAMQSELSATTMDCGVQAEETVTPSVEESAQTEHHGHCNCTVQTEVELTTNSVQTKVLAYADHETSTHDEVKAVDSAVQADEADWRETEAPPISITPRVLLPLDVYFQVHRSIIRLQCIIRGHTTRRRFYRMLNDLVNAK